MNNKVARDVYLNSIPSLYKHLRLATRYRWSILIDRVLQKVKDLLKKAAPRFELGIKDLQSSALPLGHAAREVLQPLSADRIRQSNKTVLFLANGHGEDLIARRVLEKLHELDPSLLIEVLPLVGQGKVFEELVAEKWLVKIGLTQSLPSGGFSNQSFRGFFSDIFSGLIMLTLRQWLYIRWAGANGRLIIAIGDFLPLFFAWSSGARYSFIGTPKSDYTWTSGPTFALSDFYHRLKGSEWDVWEYWLMKSSRCKMIAVRDRLTARGLRRHGVLAQAPGNPMMDGFQLKPCPESLKAYRRLLMLCGSRMPEAFDNFKRLMNGFILLNSSEPLAVLVATGYDPPLKLLESHLEDLGYKLKSSSIEIGAQSCWMKNSSLVFLGSGCFTSWASWGEIGLANAGTATEQVVGLGVPCLSLPGKGPQFKQGFAFRQSRLLGGAVSVCRSSQRLAEKLEVLLRDKQLRDELAIFGKKRMGFNGGSFILARLITKFMLNP